MLCSLAVLDPTVGTPVTVGLCEEKIKIISHISIQ